MRLIDPNLRDVLAGKYVLGTLGGAARQRFERVLANDPELALMVAGWEERLAPLTRQPAAVAPSPTLWNRVSSALQDGAESAVGRITVRAQFGVWREAAPGVRIKELNVDRAAGVRSFLMRLDPGARIPVHDHPADEDCFVIEGEMNVAGLSIRAGDSHLARKGVPHPEITSPMGALIFVRAAIDEKAA
jgi:anti-sigma-K factor RskA